MNSDALRPTRDADDVAVIKSSDVDDLRDRQGRAGEPVMDEGVLLKSAARSIDPGHIAGVVVTEAVGLGGQSFGELTEPRDSAPPLLQGCPIIESESDGLATALAPSNL